MPGLGQAISFALWAALVLKSLGLEYEAQKYILLRIAKAQRNHEYSLSKFTQRLIEGPPTSNRTRPRGRSTHGLQNLSARKSTQSWTQRPQTLIHWGGSPNGPLIPSSIGRL